MWAFDHMCEVSSLRKHLLHALSTLPGSRAFHLHLLVSVPRKPEKSLFLYAETQPKCSLQDVLILLSEESKQSLEGNASPADSTAASHHLARVFVSAIEASVYAFPANCSTVFYVSKVDGTGQGIFPSPTSTLVHALLVFYASFQSPLYSSSPTPHHLWIHLFARSQRQYLFPNSADHPNKKGLGDVALCKWWKRIISEVVTTAETENGKEVNTITSNIASSIHLYHILPGQTELEASILLRDTTLPDQLRTPWKYGHPYNIHAQPEIPFPAYKTLESVVSRPTSPETPPLASLIPYFEDDPKSRFLDELAATSEEQAVAVPVPTPRKKRQKVGDGTETANSTSGPWIPLPSSPQARFLSPTPSDLRESVLPLTPQQVPGELQNSPQLQMLRPPHMPRTPRRPKSDLDTTSPAEFWERMSFRQECAVGALTGFFVAVFSRKAGVSGELHTGVPPTSSSMTSGETDVTNGSSPTILSAGTIPHSMLKRVMSSLLTGVEFSTTERSQRATHVIETAIKGLCQGLTSTKRDSSIPDLNSGYEPHSDHDIYGSHVYSRLSTSNPPIIRKSHEPADGAISSNSTVNLLNVRRKKKRE